MSKKRDERPIVPVHVCTDDAEAEVIISLLRDHEIEAFPNSQVSHAVLPVSAGRLGQVTIYVDKSNEAEAREIIEDTVEPGEGN